MKIQQQWALKQSLLGLRKKVVFILLMKSNKFCYG